MKRTWVVAAAFCAALAIAGCGKETVRKDGPKGGRPESGGNKEKIQVTIPQVSIIPLEHEGVITDMKGEALLLNREGTRYSRIGTGDRVPFDRILNTKAKTIIELTLPTGEKAFIYSQEKESWFKIEEERR